jgi:tRNA(Ile2)-agmatinylcytidine synthase
MCTTYVAARLAERLRQEWKAGQNEASDRQESGTSGKSAVNRLCLVRLNPAIPYKTRGNAALAVHTDADPGVVYTIAEEIIEHAAETGDPETNPGLVVAPGDPLSVPESVVAFSKRALREELPRMVVREQCERYGYRIKGWKAGRGVVGALAAVGAWRVWHERDDGPTFEVISYREKSSWGTERDVDLDSVFDAAQREYPAVWDTVDRVEGEAICVPHTPGPVLHAIRGDDPKACHRVAKAIKSEPVAHQEIFHTNQGTDAHLADGQLGETTTGRGYRVTGTITTEPETRRGGHVFFKLSEEDTTVTCAAFEPTKRFRDHIRKLRVGDMLTVAGELSDKTLKLEKFAVRSLVRGKLVTPACPDCGKRMESAGRNQGYRCRDCKTSADGKTEQPISRALEIGWYEVPPVARRHVAKPLIRGGFDAPTHPER